MPERGSPSLRVVEEIAELEGVEPEELQPPLHSAVDTEALDALFRPTTRSDRTDGTVEFGYRGYTVRVEHSGDVHVTESAPSTEADTQSAADSIGD